MIKDFLIEWFGIHLPNLTAGFLGGAVKAIAIDKSRPGEVITSMLAGGFCANYLGEAAAKMTGLGIGLCCFGVGIGAMVITQGILSMITKRVEAVTAGREKKEGAA